MLIRLLAAAALLATSVSASAQADRAERARMAGRALQRARPIAEPGKVAAADIAFARAAQDEGQWTAARARIGPGALLHDDTGPFDAASWLSTRADPPAATRWAPRAVWSSCDGSLAVSYGRLVSPQGLVGDYVTVWQRQGDGDYRWLYHTATLDDPQPAPPPAVEPGPDTIIVGALDPIEGRAADCGAAADLAMDGLSATSASGRHGQFAARDNSLRWRWEHHADNRRRVVVDWVRDGRWQEAMAFDAAPATR